MAKILVCTPVALGLPRVEYSLALAGTTLSLAKAGHDVAFMLDESGSIVRSRNMGSAVILNDPSFDFLVFIDADMAWEPVDAIRDMIDLIQKGWAKVICGGYLTKWKASRWCFHTHGNPREVVPNEVGLVPLLDAPTGLMVLHRSALEELAAGRPDLKINFDSLVEHPDHPDGLIEPGTYLFFDARRSTRGRKGHYVSDDYGFSENYESVGGKIWAFPWVRISHYYTMANTATLGEWLESIGVKGLKRPDGWVNG